MRWRDDAGKRMRAAALLKGEKAIRWRCLSPLSEAFASMLSPVILGDFCRTRLATRMPAWKRMARLAFGAAMVQTIPRIYSQFSPPAPGVAQALGEPARLTVAGFFAAWARAGDLGVCAKTSRKLIIAYTARWVASPFSSMNDSSRGMAFALHILRYLRMPFFACLTLCCESSIGCRIVTRGAYRNGGATRENMAGWVGETCLWRKRQKPALRILLWRAGENGINISWKKTRQPIPVPKAKPYNVLCGVMRRGGMRQTRHREEKENVLSQHVEKRAFAVWAPSPFSSPF
jgi:hypothetical protein